MPKDIRVLIVEDDPYSRDLMSLLLTRDWRTRVVGETDGKQRLYTFIQQNNQKVDVVILDTEIPMEPELPIELAALSQNMAEPPVILYTATVANMEVFRHLYQKSFGGYVLKGEILYALASAVAMAKTGVCVITPGVLKVLSRGMLPERTVLLDGRKGITNLTPRESELTRLGIIFNLAIRDMADELVLSQGWVSEIVSTVYKKLGLREILSGEVSLENYFSNELILYHCREIKKRSKTAQAGKQLRKAPWMSTLAFHLLTIPWVEEI
ncbi:MAG: response regulator [Chloroflexota bacterium]